jgi:predicted dithiol-disulfide oxidoreductase (DUF899 family)
VLAANLVKLGQVPPQTPEEFTADFRNVAAKRSRSAVRQPIDSSEPRIDAEPPSRGALGLRPDGPAGYDRVMHGKRFPGESAEYRRARDELLEAELELRRKSEETAALRRRLPHGGAIPEDYTFEGGAGPARMSELFGDRDTLVVYNFMYGPNAAKPCPMCSSFIDGLNGNARHIAQRVALVVVARSPLERIAKLARERGWDALRVLSSASNTFNRDYHGEDERGDQRPLLHVFVKKDGAVRHSWSTEVLFVPPEPGQGERHLDPMWPLWNVLDTTPGGRGEWFPDL